MPINDHIAAAVDAALSKETEPPGVDGGAAPLPEDGPSHTDTEGSERARDEKGKFTAKEKPEGEPEKPAPKHAAPKDQAQAAAQDKQQAKAEAAIEAALNPPLNWKGAAKIDWKRLPRAVQQELLELDTASGKTVSEADAIRAALGEDRTRRMAAEYGSVENGLRTILAGAEMANQNPREFLPWYMKRMGIDPSQLMAMFGGQGAQLPQGDQQQPNVMQNPYAPEIAALQRELKSLKEQQLQAITSPIMAEIERFQADPANPYFKDVEQDIHRLLQAGIVQGATPMDRLRNAYNMAVRSRDDLYTQTIEEARKAERDRIAKENAEKIAAAKKASSSITGSPGNARVSEDAPRRNLKSTVEEAVDAALGLH